MASSKLIRLVENYDKTIVDGGVGVSSLGRPISFTVHRVLNGSLTAVAGFDRLRAGWADVAEQGVVRATREDDVYEEFRVTKIRDGRRKDGTVFGELTLHGMQHDLARRSDIPRRVLVSGTIDYSWGLGGATPDQIIDMIVATAPSYFSKGVIEATVPIPIFRWDFTNAYDAVVRLAALSGFDWSVRRNGELDYRVDLLTQLGSTADTVRFSVPRDIINEEVITSTAKHATRLVGKGGGESGARPLHIGTAIWRASAVAGDLVTIEDVPAGRGPIRYDDQLGGGVANNRWVLKPAGGLVEIVDSIAATQQIDLGAAHGVSVGDLLSIREDSVGTMLGFLEHPVRVQDAPVGFGLVSGIEERLDIPAVNNLLPDPFIRDWTGDVPDNYAAVGGATLTREQGAQFISSGDSSIKIVATGSGQGAETDALTISPQIASQFFQGQAKFKIGALDATTEGVQVQIVDATNGRVFPPRGGDEAITREVGVWKRLGVNPESYSWYIHGVTQFKVRVTFIGGGGTAYLDSAQAENTSRSPIDVEIIEGNGANILWHALNDALDVRSLPESSFRLGSVDLNALFPDTVPEARVLGGAGDVVDELLGRDFTTRIMELHEDGIHPEKSKATLSSAALDLTGLIGRRLPRGRVGSDASSSPGDRTALGITDEGGTALIDPAAGQVTPDLKYGTDEGLEALRPAEGGADVTGSHVAANVVTVSTQPAATVADATTRTLIAIDTGGDLIAGVLADDGVSLKTLLKAGFGGQAGDQDAITFPQSFQDLPAISILPAGLVDAPGAGGGGGMTILDWLGLPPKVTGGGGASDDVLEEVYADAQSVSGFILVSKINQRQITVSETTDTFGAGTLTAEGQSLALGGLSNGADDFQYRTTYDITDLSVNAADNLHTVNDLFPGGNLTTQGAASSLALSEDPNGSVTAKYSYVIEATASGSTPFSQNFPGGNIDAVGENKVVTLSKDPTGSTTVKWDRTVETFDALDTASISIKIEKDIGAGFVIVSTRTYSTFGLGGSDSGPDSLTIGGLDITDKVRIWVTAHSTFGGGVAFVDPDKIEYNVLSATTSISVKFFKNIGAGWVQVGSTRNHSVTDTDGVKDTDSGTITQAISGLDQGEQVKIELTTVTHTGSGTWTQSVDPVDCEYTAGSVTPSTVTLRVVIDKKNGLGPWVQATTPKLYQLTDSGGGGQSTSFPDEVQTFTDSAIGVGDDIRVRILELSATGSPDSFGCVVDPQDVKFNTFTGTETLSSKTPLASDVHEWIALGAT